MAEVLEILNDGHWHSIDDIRAKTNLNAKQSKEIIEFLKAYEFVTVDQKQNLVKIKETVRKFLTQKVRFHLTFGYGDILLLFPI